MSATVLSFTANNVYLHKVTPSRSYSLSSLCSMITQESLSGRGRDIDVPFRADTPQSHNFYYFLKLAYEILASS